MSPAGMERAGTANLDIRKAAVRLTEAEAMRKGSRSALLPSLFSIGIRQSSNNSSEVTQLRRPSFSSLALATVRPGVPFGTTNAVIPLGPMLLSTVANTTT